MEVEEEKKAEIKASQSSFIDINDTDMIYASKKATNSPIMEFKRGREEEEFSERN